jgi:hypothetical protein
MKRSGISLAMFSCAFLSSARHCRIQLLSGDVILQSYRADVDESSRHVCNRKKQHRSQCSERPRPQERQSRRLPTKRDHGGSSFKSVEINQRQDLIYARTFAGFQLHDGIADVPQRKRGPKQASDSSRRICYCMPFWVDLKGGDGIDHHRQGTALNFGS